MRISYSIFSIGLLCALLVACSSQKNISPLPAITDEAKASLARPINCDTAGRDISTLESERASIAEQVLAGAKSVVPVAAAADLLMGDYTDGFRVATGEYNHDIEIKIDQIKRTCRVQ